MGADLGEAGFIRHAVARDETSHWLRDEVLARRRRHRGATLVVGLAGAVAVGKSTAADALKNAIEDAAPGLRVDRVTTDGFLHANTDLAARGLVHRKGFPETYDTGRLAAFLAAVGAGTERVTAPVYSHATYDITPGATQVVSRPDVLVIDGLNLLQDPPDGTPAPRHFLNLAVYLDADEAVIASWYEQRFVDLCVAARDDPTSFFAGWAGLAEHDQRAIARTVWATVNSPNAEQHIVPTRERADVVLVKAANHDVIEVWARP